MDIEKDSFTAEIRQSIFEFTPVITEDEIKYQVKVGVVDPFMMRINDETGEFCIADPGLVDDDIMEMESLLSNAILKHDM